MSGPTDRNTTADRVLEVLELFGPRRRTITAQDVASGLGVGRSTAYRYLVSLTRFRLLEEERHGHYRLGSRIVELARVAHAGGDLSVVALPIMRELTAQTEETVLLTRLVGDRIICVERVETERAVRISYERGSVFPLNAGASPPVLLAQLADAEVSRLLRESRLPRHTSQTVTDPGRQLERVRQARADGFAVSRGELDEDVVGIASPVTAGGRTVAALGIVALDSRVPEDRLRELVDANRAAAARISAGLADAGL